VAVSPFFIAILSRWFLKTEKPNLQFFIGFLLAISGIALISFNSASTLKLDPAGDLLAAAAALAWAFYSIFTRKIGELGHNTIQTTRHIFFYGIIFMLPTLFFLDFSVEFERFADPVNLGNILFLGIGASAICFVTWNMALKRLGAVKTGVYIYLVPVVALTASVIILGEPLTLPLIAGAVMTLAGLWLSEAKFRKSTAKR
jgi:drug/metabolite transporter (DMT)-like permease